ncbi:alkane 1-monooxygenase [Gammaproteobacteria bacterium AB-CW1]|uniref:Alkane 1-monooxygenase n=1 Tax=Natronospira elongata TaxID=3110268 RepID=A0AAP6JD71_9GAMM|nr:alkane 1-monooxygenase [Gammaproteobacteria bacterium AB-CW1]
MSKESPVVAQGTEKGGRHFGAWRIGFLLPYLLPPLLIVGVALGGAWAFLPVLVVFGLIPLLDMALGRDRANPDEEALETLLRSPYYRLILLLWLPVQYALITWAVWQAGQGLDWLTLAGLAISTGVLSGGVGITVAHELGHSRRPPDRAVARLLLVSVAYLHFLVEHNRGHHARVATPDDPATARFGESFYRFWPRTVLGSWQSAMGFERERLDKAGLPRWHPRNQMIWAVLGPLGLAIAAWLLAGGAGLLLFLVQAFVAFSLLELVNYIEHYGLERQRRPNGGYAKVDIHHSWNASERFTNLLLFNLQRHSHHHAHSLTPYQALKHFDESPQLPSGYAGMIVLALIPPLWRRIMDPRARHYREQVLGLNKESI